MLGIERRELSHAALLAWVLDPRASHGMGSTPLRRFLLAAAARARTPGMLDAIDIDELDLDGLVSETEIPILDGRRRLDLLVSLPVSGDEERGAPVLILEYKVDAGEGVDQTADYAHWADAKRVPVSRGAVRPLQVFLCPDRNLGTPAPPFVTLDYDAYLDWLATLQDLDQSERARFLLREFRDCLAQREDVTDTTADRLEREVRERHADALACAARSSQEALAAFAGVIMRHGPAFAILGVSLGRRSLGDSTFVVGVRQALQGRLRAEAWSHVGGAGSVRSVFLPATEALRERHGLVVQLFMARPRRGTARLALEVVSRSVVRDDAHTALRDAVAASLRAHLGAARLAAEPAAQSTALAFRIEARGVHEPESDTEAAFAGAKPAVEAALDEVARMEAWLLDWTVSVLPGLFSPQPDTSD